MFARWLTRRPNSKDATVPAKCQPTIPGAVSKGAAARKMGSDIEQKASRWLKDQGLELVQSNYRCRLGEIDLVMNHGPLLVFVEVRYRRRIDYGGAVASVDRRKQKKLRLAAAHFLAHNLRHSQRRCRFDVIAAQANANSATIHWTWIRDAFGDY